MVKHRRHGGTINIMGKSEKSQSLTPQMAWDELIEGNKRWQQFNSAHPNQTSQRRQELREGQAPNVCVLACSDSRAPIETIFDQGLGDVFVIRTAGETVDNAVLASLEFAVEGLEIPLLVVLGHQYCGAVAATVGAIDQGPIPERFQRELVQQVAPSVIESRRMGKDTTDDFEREHVLQTMKSVLHRIPVIQERVSSGQLGVVGARYRIDDGVVEQLAAHGVN